MSETKHIGKNLSEAMDAKSMASGINKLLPLEHFAVAGPLRIFMDIFFQVRFEEIKGDGIAYVRVGQKEINREKYTELVIGTNPAKFAEMTVKQQLFVLAHEASHVLLSHLIRCDRFENQKKFNIATDAVLDSILLHDYKGYLEQPIDKATNEKIGITVESLKEKGDIETTKGYTELSADDVYGLLKGKGGDDGNGGEPGEGEGEGEGTGEGEGKDGHGNPNGGQGKKKKEKPNRIDELDKNRIDEHDPSAFDPKNIDAETRRVIDQIIKRAQEGTYGTEAGNFVRNLMKIVPKSFPFREVLDKILNTKHLDYLRPNKRYRAVPQTYIPRRRSEEYKVFVGVDCSGSTNEFIEDFLGYVMALPQFEEMVYCDTQIQHVVHKGEKIPAMVPGLGGTDLNPIFERWQRHEADNEQVKCNFILLTDGEIPQVVHGPSHSTVVIFTTNDPVVNKDAYKEWINIHILEQGDGDGRVMAGAEVEE